MVVAIKIGHIFKEDILRAVMLNDVADSKEEVATFFFVLESFAFPGLAERLARESCAQNIVSRNIFRFEREYIAVNDFTAKVDFIQLLEIVFQFAGENALMPQFLESEMESTKTGEEVYEFQSHRIWLLSIIFLLKHTKLQIFMDYSI